MGILDILFGGSNNNESEKKRDWDHSVFDDDRFRNNKSGNWVDWEDVSTGSSNSDGYEHPNYDEEGEW